MSGTAISWIAVAPLLAANFVWFYFTVTTWMTTRDRHSLTLLGIQLAITVVLGAIPIFRAYIEDKQHKAMRQKQARSSRVARQADRLENLSE